MGSEYTTLKTWKDLAMSKYGLVGGKILFKPDHLKTKFYVIYFSDDLRYAVWPLLLEVDPSTDEKIPSLEELSDHPEYQQVILDVNRSLKRFPPGMCKNDIMSGGLKLFQNLSRHSI